MEKLFILNIKDLYGQAEECTMIEANPIEESPWGTTSFTPYVCEETKRFVVPVNRSWFDDIMSTAQNQMPWEPNYNEFKETLIRKDGKLLKVFLHNSLESQNKHRNDSHVMTYHVNRISFNGGGRFLKFENEDWEIGRKYIKTPHGCLKLNSALFVDNNMFVGVQFQVEGTLTLNGFSCSEGNENPIYVDTIAILRRPNNAWLWAYAFEDSKQPSVIFCGYDDLDGFARYLSDLKENI